MARIRTIKPSFFTHEGLYDAEVETGLPIRVAYAGLWTCADREGRFKWRPRELKLAVLPYDDLDFSRVLDALTTRGFLVVYACNGDVFGWIPTFTDHQVINNREADSVLPAFEPEMAINMDENPRVPHACPTRHDLAQGERKGKEGKGKEGKELLSRVTDVTEGNGSNALRVTTVMEKGQILEDAVQTVIQHLNHVTGRRFTSKSAANLRARIRESGDVPGAIIVCKLIVDYKWSEWKDDDRMREFVNSDTLFKPTHWERYSQAAIAWNNSGRASKNGQQDLRSKFEAMVGVQP